MTMGWQVRDADMLVAGRPDPILGATQPMQEHSPQSTLQDVVTEQQPAALGEVAERSTPILGEVTERHVNAASPVRLRPAGLGGRVLRDVRGSIVAHPDFLFCRRNQMPSRSAAVAARPLRSAHGR